MCVCVCVFFGGVTLQVCSPMCLFVILAGNWVLLICVWGCRFCSNIAHMHTKRLYELNTCLQRRSSSSSLAFCLPHINKKYPTAPVTEMVIQPVPSPHLVPLLPVGLSSDSVTDGADKMRLSAFLEPWSLQGETCWWGYSSFHTPQWLLSVRCDPSSPYFYSDVLSAVTFSSRLVIWSTLSVPIPISISF